jgi:hypothetical protein
MEDMELKLLWQNYDAKLERSLALNVKTMEEIHKLKAGSALRGFKGTRWLGIVFGVLWVLFIGFLICHSLEVSKIFFVLSASVHLIVSLVAVVVYIRHLRLIDQFDNSQTVLEAQEKLMILNASNLKVLGLLLLQLPVFSTFYITFDWIRNDPQSFWLIQMPIVLIEALIGIWCYRNLDEKNRHKKWFKWFMSKGEFGSISKALSFLQEIELYKKE